MRIALVTGSTRGIGRAVAVALQEEGYAVVTTGTSQQRPEDLAAGLDYLGLNIADAAQRARAFEHIQARYGRLDLLVNNAGVAPKERQDLLLMSEESFDRVLDINLKGSFFMCQLGARMMLKGVESGLDGYQPRIVNVGSISAYTASIARGEYCISKAGIGMVTQLFAARLAAEGIPVFEIRPGIIETDMTRPVHDRYQQLIADGLLPIPRFGRPEDVAKAVLACCSGLLDYSAGQVLNVDGGFALRRL